MVNAGFGSRNASIAKLPQWKDKSRNARRRRHLDITVKFPVEGTESKTRV